MSTCNQAVLSRTEIKALQDLDLGINAIDPAVVRMPYAAGAMDLRATKTVLDASIRMPYAAGAMNLRATKTVLDAASLRMPYAAGAMTLRATKTVLTVG